MNAAGEGSADDDISTHASHFSKTGSTNRYARIAREQHSWSDEGALFPALSRVVNGLRASGASLKPQALLSSRSRILSGQSGGWSEEVGQMGQGRLA